MMTGSNLPLDDHIVRYVKPSSIDTDGIAEGTAFILRANENGLSVNWLEAFQHGDLDQQLNEVRRVIRIETSKNGKFAKLKVGDTQRIVSEKAQKSGVLSNILMIKAPLSSVAKFPADPSHAEIIGVPPSYSDEAIFVGDLIAECVNCPLYPANI